MPRKKRAPWIKLYGDYTTTPSHAGLDDRALWTGVALMQLIRAGCDARDDREPWALQSSGVPCSLLAIAQQARQPVAIARRGLELLVAAGTASTREDGAFGMPGFWRFQETPDAERKRIEKEQREAEKGRKVLPLSVPNSGVSLTREGRGESSSLRSEPPLTPPAEGNTLPLLAQDQPRPKLQRGKPRLSPPDGLAEHVFAELVAACRELSPGTAAGPRTLTAGMRDSLAKLHAAEEPTAEEWSRVIRRRLELERQGDKFGSLTWEHLCRPASFRRYRDAAGDSSRLTPAVAASVAESAAQVREREAAENAARGWS